MARSKRFYVLGGLGLAVVLAGSCAVGAVLFLGVAIWPEVQKHGASPAPTVDPDAFRQALARAHAGVPDPSAPSPGGCPDAEILANAKEHVHAGLQGEALLAIPQVTYEALGAFVQEGPTPYEPRQPLWGSMREDLGMDPAPPQGPDDWLWLEDFSLSCVFHPNRGDVAGPRREADRAWSLQQILRDVQGRRYLAVLRAETRAMPRPLRKGDFNTWRHRRRTMISGQSFEPGRFRGAVVVMDLQGARAVCQAALEVESSPTLTYRTRAPFKQRPTDVVMEDFKDRFREAVRAGLAGISRVLSPR